MKKTILLTGATDGIGFETAKKLVQLGHTLLLHGRSEKKLTDAKTRLSALNDKACIETYIADFTRLAEVKKLANDVKARHKNLDVLINNAGVFKLENSRNEEGYDIRFVVNTLAPYLLCKLLMPSINSEGRIINLSSAAQAPVDFNALRGQAALSDSAAYAQSKLAITMLTFQLAQSLDEDTPSLIAVNPASFLGSKMVKEAYGAEGKDLNIGADILVRAALDDEFANVRGKYFDNDQGAWANPHPDALNTDKNDKLVAVLEEILSIYNK